MLINLTTDYAIRFICYLTQRGVGYLATSSEISAAIEVGPKYTQKVAMMMRQAGFIASIHESMGGFKLASSPEKITLLDVVAAVEKAVQLAPCQEGGCPAEMKPVCAARQYLTTLQHIVMGYLAEVTFADLLLGCSFYTALDRRETTSVRKIQLGTAFT